MGLFSGPGLTPSLKGLPTNQQALEAGQVWAVPPSEGGWFYAKPGPYTSLQAFDPIQQLWRKVGGGVNGVASKEYIYVDGTTNYRFANQTGCSVGALLTNAGSGYSSAPTVTASAGGSIWRAIVGGAVSTTVSIANGGTNYTYPPVVVFSAPPPGGLQATGYATLSGGSVSTVTITNQGAGYNTPPTISFINDPREGQNGVSVGYNASAVASLTGSGTITGLVCIDHGTPLTSVPTLSFSGGGGSSAAATAIMCWSITSFTVSGGTGFGTSELSALDAFPTTAAAYTNPATQSGLVTTRKASILVPASSGAPTATGAVFYDRGIYTSAATPLVTTNGALITASATFTPSFGGAQDFIEFQPV
jgi:hypothetical protein